MTRDEIFRILVELSHDPIIIGTAGLIVFVWVLFILAE